MRFRFWLVLALATELAAADSAPTAFQPRPHRFTFAGFQWDQRETPNQARLLGEGQTLGGLAFSAGLPTTSSPYWFRFPSAGNFRTALTVGGLTRLNREHAAAVMLPASGDGRSERHGIEVEWSEQRALPNGAGDDLVIFEAGSASLPDGLIIRVRLAGTPTWTRWYYAAARAFDAFEREHGDGAFVYAYDLSELGLPDGDAIDAVQMANLTASDRIESADDGLSGFVVTSDETVALTRLPRPPISSGQAEFSPTQFDPDPLYVAALHALKP